MAGTHDVWVVFAEQFSTRVFVDTGICDRLYAHLGQRLRPVFVNDAVADLWAASIPGRPIARGDLMPFDAPLTEKARRRADRWLDDRVGFWPLAIRLNEREGFHADRMTPGHKVGYLDTSRRGWLPRSSHTDRLAEHWHFSARRYVPSELARRMRAECGALVLANLQMRADVRFMNAARRLRLPTVGYVASWDHTVGKGVISPHLDLYIVQNAVMRGDLVRFHRIDPARVVVTGWPQTDVFSLPRPRSDYDALISRLGLPSGRPVVLVTGNSPTNTPYEGRFVERFVSWWAEEERERLALLFRPHPRDHLWRERYSAAVGHSGIAVMEPSYTDIDDLATLLQHVDANVTNAGTILLDALVNDRPAVCVAYDEGAPPGEFHAPKNVIGEHYRALMRSGAFVLAHSFDETIAGLRAALADPGELRERRAEVRREVVGEIDGRAAERVADAILGQVG